MKKKIMVALTALACIPFAWAAKLADGYVNSETVTLGRWNENFVAVKAHADANHVPLLMFYGSQSCGYCDSMINRGLNSSVFRNWAKEHPICMVFQDKSVLTADAAKNFVKAGATSRDLPYMKIYWLKADGTKIEHAFTGRLGKMPSKVGEERGEQLVNSLELTIGDYFDKKEPVAAFAVGKTEGDRLECEEATKAVRVPVLRTGDVDVITTNAVWADREKLADIVWAPGQIETNVSVAVAGRTVVLELKNAAGEVVDETAITFVGGLRATPANPRWIGEPFGFGEWTCDFDGAKRLAKDAPGAAYTLVSVQGSMWCPDCANTDRNFLELEDDEGCNRFSAWARSNNVALVSMDIPNFTGPNVADARSPTLLTTNAYATTLARATSKENPDVSGADPSLTNKIVRSGLGYMSRKGVSDAEASAVLARFHGLVATDIELGGFHSPEDMNRFRTGVPIFVLLRKDGSVAARFTRFAATSPMLTDREKFGAYLKRFDEMLAIAAETGEHADASEIKNDGPSDVAPELAAGGAATKGEFSHVDQVDTFRLAGLGGNVFERVVVEGDSNLKVAVSFVTRDADGRPSVVGGPVTGTLSDALELGAVFDGPGASFVQVRVVDAGLSADAARAMNFFGYSIRAEEPVFVPGEARAEGQAAADAKTVKMRLVEGTQYRLFGIDTEANGAVLALDKTMGDDAFMTSLTNGDVSVRLAAGAGGKIAYQIWRPGMVGFAEAARTVSEDGKGLRDGWVEIPVTRGLGTAGWIRATISVDADPEKTTLDAARYVFETNAPDGACVLEWADGDTASKIVRVKVVDNGVKDGDGMLLLNMEAVGEFGEDAACAAGRTFILTVTDDDVETGAPTFAEENKAFGVARYVRTGDLAFAVRPGTLEDGKVSFKKRAGAIPSGLKAVWDGTRRALVFAGVPTSKAGTYAADYQVVERRGTKTVAGPVARVTFTVVDPTDVKGSPGTANASLAGSRTFKSLPVVADDKLAGVLRVTIPANGRMSAKYTGTSGAVSFSASSWAGYDAETKTLTCDLVSRTSGYSMHAVIADDGAVFCTIIDANFPDEALTATTDGLVWSKTNTAEDWQGYYTVALPVDAGTVEEGVPNVAPRGSGYLTLKMNTSSSVRSGTVAWSGLLPNGTSVSGSASFDSVRAFFEDGVETRWATLPIFKTSRRDVFSAYLRIGEKAQSKGVRRCVLAMANEGGALFRAQCLHTEKALEGCWVANMGVFGSYYDAKENLGGCCSEGYKTNEPFLSFDVEALGRLFVGTPVVLSPVRTVVSDRSIKIDASAEENPHGARLSLKASTGIVSGSFKLPYIVDEATGKTKTKSVSWKGVIVTGWGAGCGCGDYEIYLPFVSGSYYLDDKVEYRTDAGTKTLSVRRGGMVKVDALGE